MSLTISFGLDEIQVEITPEVWEEGKYGDYHGTKTGNKIRVHSLKTGFDWSTLLHECLHHISDSYGLGLDEKKVRALEKYLVLLLVQNPWLSKGLIDAYLGTGGAPDGAAGGSPGEEGAEGSEGSGEDDQGDGSSGAVA